MFRTVLGLLLLIVFPSIAVAEISCEDDAGGHCIMEDEYTVECTCPDGTVFGSMSRKHTKILPKLVGDDEPEVFEEEEADVEGDDWDYSEEGCMVALEMGCGGESWADCSDQGSYVCEMLFDASEYCGFGDDSESDDYPVEWCCLGYEEYPQEMEELLTCLEETECEDWAGTCYEGDDTNFDDLLQQTVGSKEDLSAAASGSDDNENAGSGSDDSGCSATGSASLLMLLGLAGLLRRKR